MNEKQPFEARGLSRRAFVQGTALAGVAAFLAACTGTKASSAPSATAAASASEAAASTGPSASPTVAPTFTPTPQKITGPLKFANWPAYIDQVTAADSSTGVLPAGSSKTIEDFKKKYSVDVDYVEKIDDNQSFFETIRPALAGNLATGWDLIVMTDWMAAKIITKDWAERLDPVNLPNCVKNLRDPLRGQVWDPTNDYHYPWQSGMTGVGVNTKTLAENNIPIPTKIGDLWNIPSDKVTFLSEARDTFGLGLLKLGINPDPATVTDADLQAVADDMQPLVDKGLRFTGNEYIADFQQKKVWAAFVWSGDLASSGTADDKFIFPVEGTMIWTDNMLIPKGAVNKYTAEAMMDYVYDPAVAAQIADYVYYVSPVKGADVAIKALDPGAESNPLLFPPADVVAKQRNFQFLSDELEAKMNALFAKLSGT
ncbi:MAG TPA: spermidine/putrescine ABC transporter substrate-binding protein [Candidatus Limnocylindrales bacterium]|jgi:spermidine/putrescine transport system substrate-binding protein|nr:spermidine/putrescine ABC transporter substrate-binding protein [Candidatus Limnocylindrales bacterium]